MSNETDILKQELKAKVEDLAKELKTLLKYTNINTKLEVFNFTVLSTEIYKLKQSLVCTIFLSKEEKEKVYEIFGKLNRIYAILKIVYDLETKKKDNPTSEAILQNCIKNAIDIALVC